MEKRKQQPSNKLHKRSQKIIQPTIRRHHRSTNHKKTQHGGKTKMTNPPEHKLKLGSLQLSAWKNTSEKGDFHTYTLQRSYKDTKTGEWKNTTQLRTNDLPKLSILANKMYEKANTKE